MNKQVLILTCHKVQHWPLWGIAVTCKNKTLTQRNVRAPHHVIQSRKNLNTRHVGGGGGGGGVPVKGRVGTTTTHVYMTPQSRPGFVALGLKKTQTSCFLLLV